MKILVVEDDRKVAGFIEQGLREEGYAVDVAPDGDEGTTLAHVYDYDLIVLDVMLPKKNGLQLASELRREGRSGLALLAFGTMVEPAHKIAERLDATLVNMRFVKPLDEDLIIELAARHRAIVTIEENATGGGAGSAVGELLASEGLQLPLLQLGIPDRFIEHGSRDSGLAAAGLDAAGLGGSIERWWALQPHERIRSAGGA